MEKSKIREREGFWGLRDRAWMGELHLRWQGTPPSSWEARVAQ